MNSKLDRFVVVLAFAAGCSSSPINNTGSPDMSKGMMMQNGADMTMPAACGTIGSPCCAGGDGGGTCTDPNSECSGGNCIMAPVGFNTGLPCAADKDCAGTMPTCIIKDAQGIAWPGGYCTSACNPNKNDPMTYLNTACPGGMGTCVGTGTTGQCETFCTGTLDAKNTNPCTRMGYGCFSGNNCAPLADSECTPTKTACPQDGGSIYPPTFDGGLPTYSGRACTLIGNDLLGECVDGCDVFGQNCVADAMGQAQACYADDVSGAGTCAEINNMGQDGDACMYTNDCNPTLGCYYIGGLATGHGNCRPYCRTGGKDPIPCTNGKKCIDHSTTVPSTLVGSCAG